MNELNRKNIEERIYLRDWKEKNEKYLRELEKFFDITDNVKDEELKLDIIYQMLKCDEILTKIAEERLEKEYKK